MYKLQSTKYYVYIVCVCVCVCVYFDLALFNTISQ